jgi:hypothetical protein
MNDVREAVGLTVMILGVALLVVTREEVRVAGKTNFFGPAV